MAETVLFASEQRQDLASVATFLHQLADKLLENRVILRQGATELVLELPGSVEFEIKAEEELKRNKTKQSLELEISWIVGENVPEDVTLG